MDNYKKNIFFFWDKNVPDVYLKHIKKLKDKWINYNIHLITDEFINEYYLNNDIEFGKIYNKISIGAAKADLIRLLLMYEYGGLYLDIMCEPKDSFTDIDKLFEKLNIKQVYVGAWAPQNVSLQVILSRQKSNLMFELYNLCKKNLLNQYTEEIINNNKKEYNLVVLCGPLLFHDIIVNKPFVSWNTYLKCEEDSIENKFFFDKWDCELLDIEKYFWLWRVGFDNHHGVNMDKHWSKIQHKQKLFLN
jgi:mannosyltransferase OCH1-like enzyme